MNYYVYILTNANNNVMYIGVTNNLQRRLYEHKNKLLPGFTKKYNVHKLVYFEQFSEPKYAILREKQLKGWKRIKKNNLIESVNPLWGDLSDGWRDIGDRDSSTALRSAQNDKTETSF